MVIEFEAVRNAPQIALRRVHLLQDPGHRTERSVDAVVHEHEAVEPGDVADRPDAVLVSSEVVADIAAPYDLATEGGDGQDRLVVEFGRVRYERDAEAVGRQLLQLQQHVIVDDAGGVVMEINGLVGRAVIGVMARPDPPHVIPPETQRAHDPVKRADRPRPRDRQAGLIPDSLPVDGRGDLEPPLTQTCDATHSLPQPRLAFRSSVNAMSLSAGRNLHQPVYGGYVAGSSDKVE